MHSTNISYISAFYHFYFNFADSEMTSRALWYWWYTRKRLFSERCFCSTLLLNMR